MSKEVRAFFKELGACSSGISWAGRRASLECVWKTCQRSDWITEKDIPYPPTLCGVEILLHFFYIPPVTSLL